MKITLPPTGGQGGHYGQSPVKAPKIFGQSSPTRVHSFVPRRLRGVRLRRRRRPSRRMEPNAPAVNFLVFVLVLIPLFLLAVLANVVV